MLTAPDIVSDPISTAHVILCALLILALGAVAVWLLPPDSPPPAAYQAPHPAEDPYPAPVEVRHRWVADSGEPAAPAARIRPYIGRARVLSPLDPRVPVEPAADTTMPIHAALRQPAPLDPEALDFSGQWERRNRRELADLIAAHDKEAAR